LIGGGGGGGGEIRWTDQFHLSLDLDTAERCYDQTLPAEGAITGALWLDVRAGVLQHEDHVGCSGFAEKQNVSAETFLEKRREIYLPTAE
jgi:phosphomethylpyrimidine synthase